MAENIANKRTTLRVSVINAKAYMESKGGLLAWFKGKPKPFNVINVSESGLRLLSFDKLNINEEKNFNISIPLLGVKPLNVSAKVVWMEFFEKFNGYAIGMKFTKVSNEVKSRLQHLAKFLGSKGKSFESGEKMLMSPLSDKPVQGLRMGNQVLKRRIPRKI
jgi:c-di-GMP-binding flagellar brake protein YcgR